MSNQTIIAKVIKDIGSHKLPYLLNLVGDHGATEDFYWGEVKDPLLKAGEFTNCVGATTEVLFRTLKLLGYEETLSFDDMKDLLSYCFVHDYKDRLWGVAEGIIQFGIGVEVPIEEAEYGDFAQLWHVDERRVSGVGASKSHYLGHSVVVTGIENDTVNHFSASEHSNGAGFRTLDIHREFKSGHKRQWKCARLNTSIDG